MAAPPSSPVLSLFGAPAENPLSESGRWAQLTPAAYPMLKTVGEASNSVYNGPNYSFWTPQTFHADGGRAEAFACTEGGQLGAALETWRVGLVKTVGYTFTGYLVLYGGGIGKGYFIRRYDGGTGSFTGIAEVGGGYPQKLGIVIDGDAIQAWGMYSGVWSLMVEVDDTAYRGDFYAVIGIEDPTAGGLGMPCFGAGVPTRTQFFRWSRGTRLPS